MVRAPGGVGLLNQPAGLELRGLRSGAGPIPADGAVLSADGPAGQQLREIWDKQPERPIVAAQLTVSSPVDAVVSLGAEPVVLRDGRRALPWRDPNVINPRQPHTLVGWNKAGDIYLVAVDGRQVGSEGMTMAEAADFLLSLGVTDAVNLDGGGGTTFVAGGSVWNRPSDNDPARPAEYSERGSANALVVTARPGAPLPPASPPAPKPRPPPPREPRPGRAATAVEVGWAPRQSGCAGWGRRGLRTGRRCRRATGAGRASAWTRGAQPHCRAGDTGGRPPTLARQRRSAGCARGRRPRPPGRRRSPDPNR